MEGGAKGQNNNSKPLDVFKNFKGRHAALIRALTTDVENLLSISMLKKENLCLYGLPNERWAVNLPAEIYHQTFQSLFVVLNLLETDATKEKENWCLYGLPNKRWAVNLPAEDLPPGFPEPVLGINFARDGMQQNKWLSFVAYHSDVWLLAVAFYVGARFGFGKADSGIFLAVKEEKTKTSVSCVCKYCCVYSDWTSFSSKAERIEMFELWI